DNFGEDLARQKAAFTGDIMGRLFENGQALRRLMFDRTLVAATASGGASAANGQAAPTGELARRELQLAVGADMLDPSFAAALQSGDTSDGLMSDILDAPMIKLLRDFRS